MSPAAPLRKSRRALAERSCVVAGPDRGLWVGDFAVAASRSILAGRGLPRSAAARVWVTRRIPGCGPKGGSGDHTSGLA